MVTGVKGACTQSSELWMRGYTVSSVDTCLARLGGGGWSRSKQCTTKRRCVSSLSYTTAATE